MPILSTRWRLAILTAILSVFLFLSRHFVVDDGLIYARFIANALAGNGLVFNPGENVNALTSPLFSYLLLGLSWLLHGHILLAEHLLFAWFLFATCIFAERLVPWSGVVIASTAYFYALIGLETTLFLFVLLVVVEVYSKAKYDWLPLLLFIALLLRFEAGLLIPIIGWQMWRERRFPRLRAFIAPTLLLVAYVSLNYRLYGILLPNSAASKFGQGKSGYWGKWPLAFLRVHGWMLLDRRAVFHYTPYLLPLLFFFGFAGWRSMRKTRANDVIAPFCLLLAGFYILVNMPSYHWYYAPMILFLIIYAVRGIPQTQTAYRWFAAIMIIAGISNIAVARTLTTDWDYYHVAQWINENSSPDATVETVELGQVGWFTHRHVIDILGLTFPKNAAHIAKSDPASWLMEDQPDFVIVHHPMWNFEEITTKYPEYQEVPYHSGDIYVLHRVRPLPGSPLMSH